MVSLSEHDALAQLQALFERRGRAVWPNQKLSQIIGKRPSGISDQEWSYATRAQLDFIVCDLATRMPDFAVELDDPTHRTPDARRRDGMKDAICRAAGLELLRIESTALRQGAHGRKIIEYLIDARDFMNEVSAQQEVGALPLDEPFDYRSIFGRLPNGRGGFVNDLGATARVEAEEMWKGGLIHSPVIKGICFQRQDGWVEGWAWIRVRGDFFCFEQVQLRQYQFYCGIGSRELAEDLAAAAIGKHLHELKVDAPVLVRWRQICEAFDAAKTDPGRLSEAEAALFSHISFR
ncbi:DUF2726 domain-containing protein [Micromonospora sp. HNM0581]|uniref:DUF2726 domain-containing protein n=1 Tax=Micromonospora sp. HNM0581 TaxID=2716341 RepID=UPI00146C8F14|nr:DUF2726 domain-containing protein [Micromonospora sp. HNM0581]